MAMNGRSRAGTPSLEGGGRMGTPTPGSSTPKSDGNMLLDCVVCGRQVRVFLFLSFNYVLFGLVNRSCLCVGTTCRSRRRGMHHI